MLFSDELRIRSENPPTAYDIIRRLCGQIQTDTIKKECIEAANRGKKSVWVTLYDFYTPYMRGVEFSIHFSKWTFLEDKAIKQIVWSTIGKLAEDLGLKLNHVYCKYENGSGAPSCYAIRANFSW